MVLGHRGLGVEAPVGKLLVRVRLLLRLTVHEELATPDGDRVSRQSDEPLYQVLVGVIDALEDYDVSAPGVCETVDELVHEHPVADLERRDHAARGDPEGLMTNGLTKPKTSAKDTSSMTRYSSAPPPFLVARRRSSLEVWNCSSW